MLYANVEVVYVLGGGKIEMCTQSLEMNSYLGEKKNCYKKKNVLC